MEKGPSESQRHVKLFFGFTSKQMAILEGGPGPG